MDTIPEGYQPCPFREVFRQLNVTRLEVVCFCTILSLQETSCKDSLKGTILFEVGL